MSDIFKRIKSIEASDDDTLKALGLTPDPDAATDGIDMKTDAPVVEDKGKASRAKPLNLTVAIDENDDPTKAALPESIDTPKTAENPAPKIRPLGLTPILDAAKPPIPPAPRSEPVKPIATAPEAKLTRPAIAPPKTDTVPAFVTREMDSDHQAQDFKAVIIIGIIAAVLWTLSAAFMAWRGIGTVGSVTPLNGLLWALFVIIPALAFVFGAVAIRQIGRLSQHTARLSALADKMMRPDDTVIARSAVMSKAVQNQITEVNDKVSSALSRMEMLDDMVKSQNQSLSRSTLATENTAQTINATLSAQREALEAVADTFEARMGSLSTMLDAHASNLSSSTQKAEQKIQEARISIEDAASKISSASDVVRTNAVEASETLTGSHTEIAMLGQSIKMRSSEMDAVYRKHVTDLTAMIDHLKKEQDEMGGLLEERLAKMRDMSLSAKLGAQNLSEASDKGRETVQALSEAARLTDSAVRARFAEMEDMVKYSTARAESISDTAARQVQNSLSTTRKEIARIEADMMDLMDKLSRADKDHIAHQAQAKANTQQLAAPKKPLTLRPLDSDFPPLEPGLPPEIAPPKAEDIARLNDLIDTDNVEPETLFRLEPAAPPKPKIDLDRPPEDTADGNSLQLSLEPIDIGDIKTARVDDALSTYRPDIMRPAGNSDVGSQKKDRSWWQFPGLLGKTDNDKTSVEMPKPVPLPNHNRKSVDVKTLVETLSALGLSPAAVVDDGSLIEAAIQRSTSGHRAMQQAVGQRLRGPVKHLKSKMEADTTLREDVASFAHEFASKIAALNNDKAAIQSTLESDAGRAYLICAAAVES